MDRVFLDTDIILDLLGNREPHYRFSAKLFSQSDKGNIVLYVSSLSFANLNYLLTKQYEANQARKLLLRLKSLVTVLSVTDKIVELALVSEFGDFEDALQYFTAVENGLKKLLTRNLKDYKTAEILVTTAEQYLNEQEDYKK